MCYINELESNIRLSTVEDIDGWRYVFLIKMLAFMIGCKEFIVWLLETGKYRRAYLLDFQRHMIEHSVWVFFVVKHPPHL